MRLILQADVPRPGLAERLRALSDDLDIHDVSGDESFDARALDDPEVEVLIASRAPAHPALVPKLRWLQVRSAGVDHMTADAPWRTGLVVTNAKGVYAVPIAQYVSTMILRINAPAEVWSADQVAHRWPEGDRRTVRVVRGKTAVIAGYGAIGREVARQLSALGLRIIAVKPRPDVRVDTSYRAAGTGDPEGTIPERIVSDSDLIEVVRDADYLVVTMPLTDASRGIIGAEVLAALPSHAWLVNIARGQLVDEPALLDALRSGRLAGAVLDVFATEPLPADSPFWDEPNVIVTPHASGITLEAFDDLIVENVRRYLAGEELLNRVDPERGY